MQVVISIYVSYIYVDAYQGFIVKHYGLWNLEIIKVVYKKFQQGSNTR